MTTGHGTTGTADHGADAKTSSISPRPDRKASGRTATRAAQTAPDTGPADDTGPAPDASQAQPRRGPCAECGQRSAATIAAVGELAAELDDTTRRQWAMIGAALGVGLVAVGLGVLAVLTARQAARDGQ